MAETHFEARATKVAMIAERANGVEQILCAGQSARSRQQLGVSLVICTHNGAARLPQTLAHLAAQKNTDGLTWEVIVVDNGADAWSSSLR